MSIKIALRHALFFAVIALPLSTCASRTGNENQFTRAPVSPLLMGVGLIVILIIRYETSRMINAIVKHKFNRMVIGTLGRIEIHRGTDNAETVGQKVVIGADAA